MIVFALLVATATTTATPKVSLGKPETVRELEFFIRGERARIAAEGFRAELHRAEKDLAGCKARKDRVARIVTESPAECAEAVVEVGSGPSWLGPLIGAGVGGAGGAFAGSLVRDDLGAALGGLGGGLLGCALGIVFEM